MPVPGPFPARRGEKQIPSSHPRLTRAIALTCLALAGLQAAHAQSTAVVTFDPPGTPQGPSIFVAVPGIQTIQTEPATFGGGVVLGLATFFPAIVFATSPNVYGTADFGNHLGTSLTIDINPAFGVVNEVSFALFNGETYVESYAVNAYNGTSLLTSQTLGNILPNYSSGYALADVTSTSLPITRVTIAPTTTTHATWDFLIDTVTFNQSILSQVPTTVYSPPAVINDPLPPPAPITPEPPQLPSIENQNPEVVYLTESQINSKQKRNRNGRDEEVVTVFNYGDDSNNVKGNSLDLNITDLTILPLTNTLVPEPSTGAMLLLGIASLGFQRRRGQRSAV